MTATLEPTGDMDRTARREESWCIPCDCGEIEIPVRSVVDGRAICPRCGRAIEINPEPLTWPARPQTVEVRCCVRK